MIGRDYFARQAAIVLKFAKSTTDPSLRGVLIEKATNLKSKVDETSTPSRDLSPRAPDVEH
jgi:hypothetical protein